MHREAPTARAHALAVPRPAGAAWQEWTFAAIAVALLLVALLSR